MAAKRSRKEIEAALAAAGDYDADDPAQVCAWFCYWCWVCKEVPTFRALCETCLNDNTMQAKAKRIRLEQRDVVIPAVFD